MRKCKWERRRTRNDRYTPGHATYQPCVRQTLYETKDHVELCRCRGVKEVEVGESECLDKAGQNMDEQYCGVSMSRLWCAGRYRPHTPSGSSQYRRYFSASAKAILRGGMVMGLYVPGVTPECRSDLRVCHLCTVTCATHRQMSLSTADTRTSAPIQSGLYTVAKFWNASQSVAKGISPG